MDAAALIQQLQADHTLVQQQLANERNVLQTVVEEYKALEQDFEGLNSQAAVLKDAFVSTSRILFSSVRSLWDDACQKGTVVGATAQSALTAALAHIDQTSRKLTSVGLGDLASASAVEGGEELLKAVVASAADDAHKQERAILIQAVQELEGHVQQLQQGQAVLEAELGQARAAVARAEAEATALRQQIQAQAGTPPTPQDYVIVGGTRFDSAAITALVSHATGLEARLADVSSSLTATQAEARDASARALNWSAIREAQGNAAATRIQLESALRRATDAEARLARLESELGGQGQAASRREDELRATIHSLEASNAALSRSLASVRLEVEVLQDKHAAQGGVVDMLRSELADKDSALAKADSNRQALAQRAAAALREVEGQVAQLTAAVAVLQARKQQQGA